MDYFSIKPLKTLSASVSYLHMVILYITQLTTLHIHVYTYIYIHDIYIHIYIYIYIYIWYIYIYTYIHIYILLSYHHFFTCYVCMICIDVCKLHTCDSDLGSELPRYYLGVCKSFRGWNCLRSEFRGFYVYSSAADSRSLDLVQCSGC